jgi:hypothetical protein
MKIVKTKEDISSKIWCRATEENFNALKKFGLAGYHSDWESISNEHNFLDTDILFIGANVSYFSWYDYSDKLGEEFVFNISSKEESEESLTYRGNLESLGFIEPETFNAQIFSIYKSANVTEYIGVINKIIPAKWLEDGTCVNPSKGYTLYKEYKQKIYTKLNAPGFNPKQKFKISWSEKMSLGLEQSGWRLATNDEIQGFKNEDK